MADRFTYDVFLSHNSKDKPRVRKLAEDLRAAELRVWFDEWVLKPGLPRRRAAICRRCGGCGIGSSCPGGENRRDVPARFRTTTAGH